MKYKIAKKLQVLQIDWGDDLNFVEDKVGPVRDLAWEHNLQINWGKVANYEELFSLIPLHLEAFWLNFLSFSATLYQLKSHSLEINF